MIPRPFGRRKPITRKTSNRRGRGGRRGEPICWSPLRPPRPLRFKILQQPRALGGLTPSRIVARVLLGLLAVLDDVALGEQDLAQDRSPLRRAAQQELEV